MYFVDSNSTAALCLNVVPDTLKGESGCVLSYIQSLGHQDTMSVRQYRVVSTRPQHLVSDALHDAEACPVRVGQG
jgi:hypothetical protein